MKLRHIETRTLSHSQSRLQTEQHSYTAGPVLRCMCFCTAGFETYAAYALLVAKALLRDGTIKLNYILSPSIYACIECACEPVSVCLRACVCA